MIMMSLDNLKVKYIDGTIENIIGKGFETESIIIISHTEDEFPDFYEGKNCIGFGIRPPIPMYEIGIINSVQCAEAVSNSYKCLIFSWNLSEYDDKKFCGRFVNFVLDYELIYCCIEVE